MQDHLFQHSQEMRDLIALRKRNNIHSRSKVEIREPSALAASATGIFNTRLSVLRLQFAVRSVHQRVASCEESTDLAAGWCAWQIAIKKADADMYVAIIDDKVTVKLGPRYDMGDVAPNQEEVCKSSCC
jgi:Alpha-amylase C-terminal beta-sheet domain